MVFDPSDILVGDHGSLSMLIIGVWLMVVSLCKPFSLFDALSLKMVFYFSFKISDLLAFVCMS